MNWLRKCMRKKDTEKSKNACIHQLQPIIYPRKDTIPMWQCIKCGEFYR